MASSHKSEHIIQQKKDDDDGDQKPQRNKFQKRILNPKLRKLQPKQATGKVPSMQDVLPISDNLDPFAALPTKLGRFEGHLITFYLQHYPKMIYGLSPNLKPHPVTSNFQIALSTPACFHVILARAALYRNSLTEDSDGATKQLLETAHAQHKGNAIRKIREAVEDDNLGVKIENGSLVQRKEDLIASIISLGTLDKRTGNETTAATHFQAVRTLLRSCGGAAYIQSAMLSRVMCHFECVYGTKDISYVWDREHDFQRLLGDVNIFFKQLWRLYTAQCDQANYADRSEDDRRRQPLHTLLFTVSRDLFEPVMRPLPALEPGAEPLPKHRIALVFQLTCLLTLCLIIVDTPISIMTTLGGLTAPTKSLIGDASSEAKQQHKSLQIRLNDPTLTDLPLNNHAWILQTYDIGSAHSVRIWRAAGFVWILKHASFSVQKDVATWLCEFAKVITTNNASPDGRADSSVAAKAKRSNKVIQQDQGDSTPKQVETKLRPFKLEPFHFSYAV